MSNPNKMTNWYFGLSSLQLLITAGIAFSRGRLQSCDNDDQHLSGWNIAATGCHLALLALSCVTLLLRTKPVCDGDTPEQTSNTINDESSIDELCPVDYDNNDAKTQRIADTSSIVTGALKNVTMISQSMLGFGLVCIAIDSMGRLPVTEERVYSGLQFGAVALYMMEHLLHSQSRGYTPGLGCNNAGTSLATIGLAGLAVMFGGLGSASAAQQTSNMAGDMANYHSAGLLSTGSALLITMSAILALVHACQNKLSTTTSSNYETLHDPLDVESGNVDHNSGTPRHSGS